MSGKVENEWKSENGVEKRKMSGEVKNEGKSGK